MKNEDIVATLEDRHHDVDIALEYYSEKKASLLPFVDALESSLLGLNQLYRRSAEELSDYEHQVFSSVLTSVEAALEHLRSEME